MIPARVAPLGSHGSEKNRPGRRWSKRASFAGEPNEVCAIGMSNAGGYYHHGTPGPQVVRCVRGAGTFPMVKACTMALGCSSW